jgi:PhnB protein
LNAESDRAFVRGGFDQVRPYLYGNADVVRFVTLGLEGKIAARYDTPDGAHLEIIVGDAYVIIESADSFPDHIETTTASVYVYVPDVDLVYDRAMSLGLHSVSAPQDKPYDERQCGVRDAAGNVWWISTYVGAPVT